MAALSIILALVALLTPLALPRGAALVVVGAITGAIVTMPLQPFLSGALTRVDLGAADAAFGVIVAAASILGAGIGLFVATRP